MGRDTVEPQPTEVVVVGEHQVVTVTNLAPAPPGDPCPKCGLDLDTLQLGQYPFCKGKPEDHGFPHGYRDTPFKSFSLEVDGQTHHFSSLHQIRQFERESEKRAADGVGQPYAFRAFSNDMGGGRQLVNSFGKTPRREFSTRDRYGRPYVGGAFKPKKE